MSQYPKQQGHYGRRLYITPENETVAQKGFVAGGELSVGNKGGSVVLPGNPAVVAFFDDFLGDLIADEWNAAEGDTGHNAIAVQPLSNGVLRMHMSSTAAKTVAAYNVLNHGLFPQWKAKQGNLRMSARVKLSNEDGANVFIGFADTGAALMVIRDTGSNTGVPLSAVSNCVGWLYSGGDASPSGAWRGVACNTDTVATPVAGVAPTNNVYDVLEFEIGDTGAGGDGKIARFYQNGVLKGSITSPVLATRVMTPVVSAFSSEDTGNLVDIDFINFSANRDTGD